MLQTDDRTLRDPGPASRNVSPDDRVPRVPRKAIEQAVVQVFGVGQEDLRRGPRQGRVRPPIASVSRPRGVRADADRTGRLFGRDCTTVAPRLLRDRGPARRSPVRPRARSARVGRSRPSPRAFRPVSTSPREPAPHVARLKARGGVAGILAASVNALRPTRKLLRRKDRDGEALISQAQFDAGERLRADFCVVRIRRASP